MFRIRIFNPLTCFACLSCLVFFAATELRGQGTEPVRPAITFDSTAPYATRIDPRRYFAEPIRRGIRYGYRSGGISVQSHMQFSPFGLAPSSAYSYDEGPGVIYNERFVEAPIFLGDAALLNRASQFAPPQVDSNQEPATTFLPANQRAKPFLAQAENLFREKRFAEADRAISHALLEDGENGKLNLFASQAKFAVGDYQAAGKALESALNRLEPSQSGFVVENFRRFYGDDSYVRQMNRLVQHCTEHPGDANAHALRGYHYQFLGTRGRGQKGIRTRAGSRCKSRACQTTVELIAGRNPGPPAATIKKPSVTKRAGG